MANISPFVMTPLQYINQYQPPQTAVQKTASIYQQAQQPFFNTQTRQYNSNQPNQTQPQPVNNPAPSGGGGGGGGGGGNAGGYRGSGMDQGAYDLAQARAEEASRIANDPYAQLKAEISSGWDQYLSGINDIGETYLPQQRTAQENIANSQLEQGQNTINQQKAKSLRDISGNIRNAFQAGNVFLGARGAGDSSAANQYSFAIGQEANKQTGNLNEFVNGQLSNLQSTHDQQIQSIAQWFAEQQSAIKQAVAQGQLNKSRDIQNISRSILDQAISAANQVKSDSSNRYNALLQWAANNSQNVGQLQQNIAGIPRQFAPAQVDSTGNFQVPVGTGSFTSDTQRQQPLFQNPAWFQ